MKNAPLVRLSGISKSFRPTPPFHQALLRPFDRPAEIRALADVSLDAERGRVVGLLGPNGAGKTTLLKVLATLILPDKGTGTIDGWTLGRDDEHIKRCIGLITSEERSFYWRLSGRENLFFFAALHDLTGTRARRRIDELLAFFEVDYADRRFDGYSSGMKQRFAFIRGLLHDPRILLLDEPFANIDYKTQTAFKAYLRRLAVDDGKAVLLATHLVSECADLCDTFVIMDRARILGLGALEDLRQKLGCPGASLGEVYLRQIAQPPPS